MLSHNARKEDGNLNSTVLYVCKTGFQKQNSKKQQIWNTSKHYTNQLP